MIRSNPHSLFLLHVKARGLPEPVCEYRFDPDRRYRLDVAWPDRKIGVEIHGGAYGVGPQCPKCGQRQAARHTRGDGFANDRAKMNRALEMGWKVFEYTTKHVEAGVAITQMEAVLTHGCNT